MRNDGVSLDRLTRPSLFAPLLAVAGTWLAVAYADREPPLPDEGAMLTHAAKILRGAVFYRDLDAYPFPAASYALALAMKLFGEHFTVARALAGALHCVALLALYAAALRVLDARRAALFGLLLLALKPLAWPAFTFYLYSEFAFAFACVGIACLLWQRRPGASLGLLAAGASCGVALLAKQNLGAFLLGAGALLLLLPRIHTGRPAATWSQRASALTAFGVGVALPVLPTLAYFAVHGVLGAMLESGLLRPLRAYLPSSGVAFTPMLEWWKLGELAGAGEGAKYLPFTLRRMLASLGTSGLPGAPALWIGLEALVRLLYTSIPVALAWALGRRLRRGGCVRARERSDATSALALLAAAAVASAWPRADFYHVIHVYPVVLLLLFALVHSAARPEQPPRVAAGIVALVVALAIATGAWHRSRTSFHLELERAELWIAPDAAWLGTLVRGIRAEVPPGEPIFVYGHEAHLYFLSDRYNAWPFAQLYPGQTGPEGGEALVALLEREPPRLIVQGLTSVPGVPPIPAYAPELARYVATRFARDTGFATRHGSVEGSHRTWRPSVLKPRAELSTRPSAARLPGSGRTPLAPRPSSEAEAR